MWPKRWTERRTSPSRTEEPPSEPICLGPVEVLGLIQRFGTQPGMDKFRLSGGLRGLDAVATFEAGFRI